MYWAAVLALVVGSGALVAVPVMQEFSPTVPLSGHLPAPEGRTQAFSGDTVEFEGMVFRLDGLFCPDPETEAGQKAKALMNTLLRAPYVECLVIGGTNDVPLGRCSRDGRGVAAGTDFAVVMRRSGICK